MPTTPRNAETGTSLSTIHSLLFYINGLQVSVMELQLLRSFYSVCENLRETPYFVFILDTWPISNCLNLIPASLDLIHLNSLFKEFHSPFPLFPLETYTSLDSASDL